MAFFIINGLGYNCQYQRENCPNKLFSCKKCLVDKLNSLGFDISSELKIYEVLSEEKRLEMEKKTIWQKFLDVLNIKHILIMEKETGLVLLNYPVSSSKIDVDLLSGFIQANITFSESNHVSKSGDQPNSDQFYEFQYKDFNILLREGEYIRNCLILDHKASVYMRNNMNKFITNFEVDFKDNFISLRETGLFDNKGMPERVIKDYDVNLVFPMILAYAIPPEELDHINQNLVQKAIYDLALEILGEKPFFYINNLLKNVQKIVKIEPNTVLYEIYRLYEKKIIISKPLENIFDDIEEKYEKTQVRKDKMKPIASMIVKDQDVSTLRDQMKDLNHLERKNLIRNLIKRAKKAERSLAYQNAQEQYQKALIISREFSLTEEIKKVSQLLFNLEKNQKKIELEFAIETAELAEKSKDYIKAIHSYQKALKIMESNLIYAEPDPRMKKFKKKISKMRQEI